VLDDEAIFAAHAAEWLIAAVERASGPCAIALSGGSTPRSLYEMLARPPWRDRIPWDRAHWFWGDERFVAHDDPQSNYRMVRDALLSHVPVPPGHVHPIPTSHTTPESAARDYESELRRVYGSPALAPARPLFAATLLGLGEDGHTASLFPHSPALEERMHWVAPVLERDPSRITLTYPALESSASVAFLVTGEAKRNILRRLIDGDAALPASHVQPVGDLHLFADHAAAGNFFA
jgi:6-phosphogluconolactonase